MFRQITPDEVQAAARSLGITLSCDEAVVYSEHASLQLGEFDTLMQSRTAAVPGPPLLCANRGRGQRPTEAEDPLNAWMWRCRINAGVPGVLSGRTVAFKDHIAVAGIPMRIGSFAFEDFVPGFDATVVTRTLMAGGTVVGKNVMNGLSGGFGTNGRFGDYGRPLNPHDHTRLTGGSSSGSAVAVVAGDVDIAFGGDQGGSVRVPAAWCGAVGLKPTFGLLSHFGAFFGADPSVDHIGPIGREVQYVAAAVQATAGYDVYDPRQRRDVPDRVDMLTDLDRGVAGLRIGMLEEGFAAAEPEVAQAVRRALGVLEDQGASVCRISVPEHLTMNAARAALRIEGALALFRAGYPGPFSTYYPPEFVVAVNKFWDTDIDEMAPHGKYSLIVGELSRRRFHGRVYARAQNLRAAMRAAYDLALSEVDVLVMPTVTRTAPKYEPGPDDYVSALDRELSDHASATVNTSQFNYTGHPAMAMPIGKLGGLPVSMQIVGRHFSDSLVLQVGYAFQEASDWEGIVSVRSTA